MKGDDPEIDTAQTPKRFDECLAVQEKIRKTFTDSIPNNLLVVSDDFIFEASWNFFEAE